MRIRQFLIAGSVVLATLGVGAVPAHAWTQRSSGCVEWNSTQGCVVTQSCSVDTDAQTWSCLTWDTRTHTLTGTSGAY